MVWIEELIVIDFRFLPKNPLPAGLIKSLRRAALDLITQSVLPLIGKRQIRIVQHHKPGSQEHTPQQQRQRDAVEAKSAGLKRDEFVVLGHYAKRDQDGDKGRERRELVEQIAGQIHKIEDDVHGPGPMLRNIVQQFKKCEDLEEHEEPHGEHHEIVDKAAEQINIQELRDAGAPSLADKWASRS